MKRTVSSNSNDTNRSKFNDINDDVVRNHSRKEYNKSNSPLKKGHSDTRREKCGNMYVAFTSHYTMIDSP